MPRHWLPLLLSCAAALALPFPATHEVDSDESRRVLGSSVVTSVSVIMDLGNGTKAYFADAAGRPVAKPSGAVGSPAGLMAPDRYEFYTFDEAGDLVKRFMSLSQIHSIIAGGEGSPTLYHDRLPGETLQSAGTAGVRDVVASVQNVLKSELEATKNNPPAPIVTPPTQESAASWSAILPAIMGGSAPIHSESPTTKTTVIPSTTEAIPTTTTVKIPEIIHTKQASPSTTTTKAPTIAIKENIPTTISTKAPETTYTTEAIPTTISTKSPVVTRITEVIPTTTTTRVPAITTKQPIPTTIITHRPAAFSSISTQTFTEEVPTKQEEVTTSLPTSLKQFSTHRLPSIRPQQSTSTSEGPTLPPYSGTPILLPITTTESILPPMEYVTIPSRLKSPLSPPSETIYSVEDSEEEQVAGESSSSIHEEYPSLSDTLESIIKDSISQELSSSTPKVITAKPITELSSSSEEEYNHSNVDVSQSHSDEDQDSQMSGISSESLDINANTSPVTEADATPTAAPSTPSFQSSLSDSSEHSSVHQEPSLSSQQLSDVPVEQFTIIASQGSSEQPAVQHEASSTSQQPYDVPVQELAITASHDSSERPEIQQEVSLTSQKPQNVPVEQSTIISPQVSSEKPAVQQDVHIEPSSINTSQDSSLSDSTEEYDEQSSQESILSTSQYHSETPVEQSITSTEESVLPNSSLEPAKYNASSTSQRPSDVYPEQILLSQESTVLDTSDQVSQSSEESTSQKIFAVSDEQPLTDPLKSASAVSSEQSNVQPLQDSSPSFSQQPSFVPNDFQESPLSESSEQVIAQLAQDLASASSQQLPSVPVVQSPTFSQELPQAESSEDAVAQSQETVSPTSQKVSDAPIEQSVVTTGFQETFATNPPVTSSLTSISHIPVMTLALDLAPPYLESEYQQTTNVHQQPDSTISPNEYTPSTDDSETLIKNPFKYSTNGDSQTTSHSQETNPIEYSITPTLPSEYTPSIDITQTSIIPIQNTSSSTEEALVLTTVVPDNSEQVVSQKTTSSPLSESTIYQESFSSSLSSSEDTGITVDDNSATVTEYNTETVQANDEVVGDYSATYKPESVSTQDEVTNTEPSVSVSKPEHDAADTFDTVVEEQEKSDVAVSTPPSTLPDSSSSDSGDVDVTLIKHSEAMDTTVTDLTTTASISKDTSSSPEIATVLSDSVPSKVHLSPQTQSISDDFNISAELAESLTSVLSQVADQDTATTILDGVSTSDSTQSSDIHAPSTTVVAGSVQPGIDALNYQVVETKPVNGVDSVTVATSSELPPTTSNKDTSSQTAEEVNADATQAADIADFSPVTTVAYETTEIYNETNLASTTFTPSLNDGFDKVPQADKNVEAIEKDIEKEIVNNEAGEDGVVKRQEEKVSGNKIEHADILPNKVESEVNVNNEENKDMVKPQGSSSKVPPKTSPIVYEDAATFNAHGAAFETDSTTEKSVLSVSSSQSVVSTKLDTSLEQDYPVENPHSSDKEGMDVVNDSHGDVDNNSLKGASFGLKLIDVEEEDLEELIDENRTQGSVQQSTEAVTDYTTTDIPITTDLADDIPVTQISIKKVKRPAVILLPPQAVKPVKSVQETTAKQPDTTPQVTDIVTDDGETSTISYDPSDKDTTTTDINNADLSEQTTIIDSDIATVTETATEAIILNKNTIPGESSDDSETQEPESSDKDEALELSETLNEPTEVNSEPTIITEQDFDSTESSTVVIDEQVNDRPIGQETVTTAISEGNTNSSVLIKTSINNVAEDEHGQDTVITTESFDSAPTTTTASEILTEEESTSGKVEESTSDVGNVIIKDAIASEINAADQGVKDVVDESSTTIRVDAVTTQANGVPEVDKEEGIEQEKDSTTTEKEAVLTKTSLPTSSDATGLKDSAHDHRPLAPQLPPHSQYDSHVTSSTPVELYPPPRENLGLEGSTLRLSSDVRRFTDLCNELAFRLWSAVTVRGLNAARSVVMSPIGLTSILAMVFLGARGPTSGQMNDILRLDDMVTFNPHQVFRNVTESVVEGRVPGVATAAFVRELYSDRTKGKLLNFYKERAQQFYDGHVEEVNFNMISDIVRRRTNLLVKRQTRGKVPEYLRGATIMMHPPLAAFSANIFQTDCSMASTDGRDGEMYFTILPSTRQRRLVPVPAAVWRSGFLAGYEPSIDATAVALGAAEGSLVSVLLLLPGQQGQLAPGDGLGPLEQRLLEPSFRRGAWSRVLRCLAPRPSLELQLPRFSHRSLLNLTSALQRMGLKDLFSAEKADLRGLNGIPNDLHLSDIVQVNTFSTCAEDNIGTRHHVEVYPASPQPQRTGRVRSRADHADLTSVPLALRPRQARLPENPRLRLDRPFLYFVRHNPTGFILHMGRFNPHLRH